MPTLTAHIRNGRVELDEPLPPDWAEGAKLQIEKAEPHANGIDLTGDTPEAIAAWLAWYEALGKTTADSTFPEELERILAEAKTEELKMWEARCRRIEGLFP